MELAKVEEKISKLQAKELYDSEKICSVNIAKDNFRFAPVEYLETSLKSKK